MKTAPNGAHTSTTVKLSKSARIDALKDRLKSILAGGVVQVRKNLNGIIGISEAILSLSGATQKDVQACLGAVQEDLRPRGYLLFLVANLFRLPGGHHLQEMFIQQIRESLTQYPTKPNISAVVQGIKTARQDQANHINELYWVLNQYGTALFSAPSVAILCDRIPDDSIASDRMLEILLTSPHAGKSKNILTKYLIELLQNDEYRHHFPNNKKPLAHYTLCHMNSAEISNFIRIILEKDQEARTKNCVREIVRGLIAAGYLDTVLGFLDFPEGKDLFWRLEHLIFEELNGEKEDAKFFIKYREKIVRLFHSGSRKVREWALKTFESAEGPRAIMPIYDQVIQGERVDLGIIDKIGNQHPVRSNTRKIKTDLEAKIKSLPFQLTGDQHRAFREICADMRSSLRMQRILQGDVGCGKTVVALLSLWLVIRNGKQGCFLAPTTILAQQHYKNAQEFFKSDGIHVELCIGNMSTRDRAGQRERIKNGTTHLIIGTHALLDDETDFKDLGLLVIDEQQKFGVLHRSKLTKMYPHVLEMSATPIPRSLRLKQKTVFDYSDIHEHPKNRQPTETHLISEDEENGSGVPSDREELLLHLNKHVSVKNDRHQAFWICSRVGDIKERCEELQTRFPEMRIAGVHGKHKEKQKAIDAFHRGEIDLLVSTSIIDVGMDIAHADMMVVENPLSFGLSQLHQMRGRIGRAGQKSYFYMLDPSWSENEGKKEEQEHRINTMLTETDGFKIAESDLIMLGPGSIYGTLQSGKLAI